VRKRVVLVVTEHPSRLTSERRTGYERVRRTIEVAAARPTTSVHYLDVGRLRAGAVILSGSSAPWAAHDPAALARLGGAVEATEAPVLGICAGMQLLAGWGGGEVRPLRERGAQPERGYEPVEVLDDRDLLQGLGPVTTVFQDHEDEVTLVPEGFRVLARTPGCEVQALAAPERRWWGTQFHAECFDAEHPDGERVLQNFFGLAGA